MYLHRCIDECIATAKSFAETHHIYFMPDFAKMTEKEIESNAHLTYVTDHQSWLVIRIDGVGVHTIDDEAGEVLYDEVPFVKLHIYFEDRKNDVDVLKRHNYDVIRAADDNWDLEAYLTQTCFDKQLFETPSGVIRKDLRQYVIRKSFG